MLIRKLSIFGFKSFAEKTELTFGQGMTAVIGPNGCGKSNVVDAIRWVFGEQKASILRSNNMQDVIFSGSDKRQPLNMAEVTLTISNHKGILPIEYNEVAITRRIFRSGESEYLINKTPSRLKDIQDLFIDTGVGTSSYTTIENSMINRILSDKAEERRMLFEEAAGIGKFKHRIRESQKKLDRTKQDLLRINDRVQEKDRYVRILARQVEKARRYQQYHDDLKKLELSYENQRFLLLNQCITERKKSIGDLDLVLDGLKTQRLAAESRIEKLEIDKLQKENDVTVAGKSVSDARERINATERELSVTKQSLSFLRQNIVRFDQEMESFNQQTRDKNEQLSAIENGIVTKSTQRDEYVQQVASVKGELQEFDARINYQREKSEELNHQLLEAIHLFGSRQKDLGNSQTNLVNNMDRAERDQNEIRRLEEQIEEYGVSLDTCKEKLAAENESFANHMRSREQLWKRIEKEEASYHTLVEKEKKLEAQIDSCKSKLRFLEGLDAQFEGYSTGVKALLEKKEPGLSGIIANVISLRDASLASLVEKALGSAIQTVVLQSQENLTLAMHFLNSNKAGVARIVSLDRLDTKKIPPRTAPVAGTFCLRDQIIPNQGYELLADLFFNRILVCDTAAQALALQPSLEHDALLVSRDGQVVCFGNQTVVAGSHKKEQVGILQRKQEIEKCKNDIIDFDAQYNVVVNEKDICIMNRDEAKRALIEIDDKLNRGRQKQQEQQTNIKHYENEIQNIRERIQILVPELTKIRLATEELQKKIGDYQRVLEDMQGNRRDIEGQLESAKGRLSEMTMERTEIADRMKDLELAKQGMTNRLEQDRQNIEGLKRDIRNLGATLQKKHEDKNNALAEIARCEERLAGATESLACQLAQRDELQKVFDQCRESYNAQLTVIDEIRKEVKLFSGQIDENATSRHSLDVEQTRDEEHRKSIREKIFTAYEIDLQSPQEPIPALEPMEESVDETIAMLKERLRRVGEVNIGAIKEYEQEDADLKMLVAQRDDLQSAVDDLEQAIKKLNKEARNQFIETFEQVQKNFKEMFITLFEGGEASLTLEENIDPLEAPIHINVRPAGKKMRGVTLLSGGERALTAISLLFALYLVKPSAYCILDELDAPLDDANVGRFVRILRKFSEKTQFIVITHNKNTMEAADILYGVTQQESGVSTIASIRLADVTDTVAA